MGIGSTVLRVAKLMPEFILGCGSEPVGQGIRATKGSIWAKIKGGGKALKKDIARQTAKGGGGFFKRNFKSLISLPKDMYVQAKRGVAHTKWVNRQLEKKLGGDLAKSLAKSPIKGALGGVFKAIGKRMPVIGVLITAAIEAPNIKKAYQKDGIGGALKESAGVGVELGCMATGAAIGSAICPGIGTLVGGIVGSIVGMCVRGKTASQKEEEEKAAIEQAEGAEANAPVKYTKDEITALKQLGLTDKEIEYAQKVGIKAEEIPKILADEYSKLEEKPVSTQVDNTKVQQQQQIPVAQDLNESDIAAQIKQELEEIEQKKQAEAQGKTQAQVQTQTQQQKTQYPYTINPQGPLTSADCQRLLYQLYGSVMANPYQQTTGNSYTNDMFYKQAFGGYTNPYLQYPAQQSYQFYA